MHEIARPSLSERTTLRLGGHALAELIIESQDDLDILPERLATYGVAHCCIGRGSNILAMDGELPLVLLKIGLKEKLQVTGEENGKVLVRASADTPLPKLLKFCMNNGLSGMEGLAGIPGTVGGAVAMNAGSFGTDTAACLHEVDVFSENRKITYKSSQIAPHYRHMEFEGAPQNPVILGSIFALTKGLKSVISRAMNLNFFEKMSRQPLDTWSAGSAFKNPGNGLFAARLLEEAGYRGRRLGGMAFSQKHANFLINEGNGDAGAALDLMNEAREAVKKLSGIELEPEIRIIPWH